MGLKIFRLKLVKYKPWVCRKLGKSSVSVICVVLVLILFVQLTHTESFLLSSSSSSPLLSPPINDRTPRSIDDKFRVFKYVTEDQLINSNVQSTTESKINNLNPKPHKTAGPETLKNAHQNATKPVVPSTSKKHKKGNSKGVIVNNKKNGGGNGNTMKDEATAAVDPVLKSSKAPSVTDRSLIPNSYFKQADPQAHNVERVEEVVQQLVKNHHHRNHSDNPLQKPSHQQNGNHKQNKDYSATDGSSSSSSLQTRNNNNNSTNNNNTRLAQNRNSSGGPVHKNEGQRHPNLEKEMNSTYADEIILSFNGTLLSERSRHQRSPFGRRNNIGGGRIMYQNHMPIMHQNQNAQRRASNGGSNRNNGNFVRKMNKGGGNKRNNNNNNNRAALYNRNHQQQNIFPVQISFPHQNLQLVGNNAQFKQVPIMIQNSNMNRGVAVVMPPAPPPQQKMDTVLPSPSSDFVQYQTIQEEPTWNHPMYQRYKKVAKNVQNKMSGLVSRRSNNPGQAQRDHFRSEFSKMPPIPLPRPRPGNKGRGVRSRPKGGPPPPPQSGRYTYPKSAHSIQDILNHFQTDNNDIMNDVEGPGPKSSGSRYPIRNKNARNNNRNNNNNDEGDRHRDEGPIIADLSGELKDVRFSLLRDIREFAKRPMTMGGDSDGPSIENASPPPPERYKKEPVVRLRSPQIQKPLRRIKDHDHEDDDDSSWRKKHKKYASDRDDPFSPEYNHESGFDDIFHPKPKPVRDMVNKKSSRFRQPSLHHDREREESREKDYHDVHHSSRKKKHPPYDSPYYYADKKSSPKHKHSSSRHDAIEEDSTERSFKDSEASSLPHMKDPSSPFSGSVEVEMERKHDTHRRDKDRDRDRERGQPMDYDRDGDRSYLSSHEIERIRRPNTHSQRDRERERDYPKSIRDKIRDMHGPHSSIEYPPSPETKFTKKAPYDYDSDTRPDYKFPSPFIENKPIVLKRPYEPYQAPPPPPEINNKEKKMQNHEFWNNYAAATEKSMYGYSNPQPSLNLAPPPQIPSYGMIPQPPPTLSSATINPYYISGRPSGGIQEDIVEIHTGQIRPPPSNMMPSMVGSPYGHNTADNGMQKAYLELLQQKMHSDASLLNNQVPLPLPPPKITTTTRKTPTPMRMKIHIYPNEQTDVQQPTQANKNNQNQQYQTTNVGGSPSGYYSGGSSYSSNTVPLLSPRYPQKVGGITLNGYNNNNNNGNLHLGPGPAPTFHGGMNHHQQQNNNHHYHQHRPDNYGDKGSSSSGDKNNKNLVLHLHVHRRNDAGPAELEAEGSDHFMSTDKPSQTYKEIYDEHNSPNNQHQQDLSNHASANNGGGGNNGGEPEGDISKSVSMEVPIHDDKIEDVLHTLLQLRDRNPSRRK